MKQKKKSEGKKSLSVNAICYILAAIIGIGFPSYQALASDTTSVSKRSDSGLKSTGNVEYCDRQTGARTVVFAVEDLYYLENRIEDELAVICQ